MAEQTTHYQARFVDLRTLEELRRELSRLQVDKGGIPVMAPKAVHRLVLVENVLPQAANIIKQEVLARDGDCAVHWKVGSMRPDRTDILIIGNLVTLRSLVAKLFRQAVYDLAAIGGAIQGVLERTVPGYLPVTKAPPREGTPEEHVEELLGGRTRLRLGGRVSGHPEPLALGSRTWQFGAQTWLVGALASGRPGPGSGPDLPAAARQELQAGAHALSLDEPSGGPGWTATVRSLVQLGAPVCVTLTATAAPYMEQAGAGALGAGAQMLRVHGGLAAITAAARAAAGSPVALIAVYPWEPGGTDVLSSVHGFFAGAMAAAEAAGCPRSQVILDPAVHAAPDQAKARLLLRRMAELRSLGCPLLFTAPAGAATAAAAITLAISAGADILEVHDLPLLHQSVELADAVLRRPTRREDP